MAKDKEHKAENMESQSEKAQHGKGGPMEMGMGMGMAKKMMEKMGEDAPNPIAMRKKMMGKKPSAEGETSGNPMMEMCKNMLGTIKRTNEMALHATPELQGMFAEWLGVLEDEAMEHFAKHPETEVKDLATALKISKESAVYLVARLGITGKINLTCQAPAQKSPKTPKTTKKDTKASKNS